MEVEETVLFMDVNTVPYRPEYTVPASNPVHSTPLFRTGKNTGRTGLVPVIPANFGQYRPVPGVPAEEGKHKSRKNHQRSRDQRRRRRREIAINSDSVISRSTLREIAPSIAINGVGKIAISRRREIAIDASRDRAVDRDLGRRRDRDQLRDLATARSSRRSGCEVRSPFGVRLNRLQTLVRWIVRRIGALGVRCHLAINVTSTVSAVHLMQR
uniref:Uncharacterized protein n=1 Tax=Quercus lobata TaxID=97700 RepID=A0A7N2LP16_QUELO